MGVSFPCASLPSASISPRCSTRGRPLAPCPQHPTGPWQQSGRWGAPQGVVGLRAVPGGVLGPFPAPSPAAAPQPCRCPHPILRPWPRAGTRRAPVTRPPHVPAQGAAVKVTSGKQPGKGSRLLGQAPPSSVDIQDVPEELSRSPDDEQSQELLLCTRLLSYTKEVQLSNTIDVKGASLQEFLCKSFPAKTWRELSQTNQTLAGTPGWLSGAHRL